MLVVDKKFRLFLASNHLQTNPNQQRVHLVLVPLFGDGFAAKPSRSTSSALLPFLGEGSPTK